MATILTRPTYKRDETSRERKAAHLIRSQECNPSFETLRQLCTMDADFRQIFVFRYPVRIHFCRQTEGGFSFSIKPDSLSNKWIHSYLFFRFRCWLEYIHLSIVQHDFVLFSLCWECLLWFCCFFLFSLRKRHSNAHKVQCTTTTKHNSNSW